MLILSNEQMLSLQSALIPQCIACLSHSAPTANISYEIIVRSTDCVHASNNIKKNINSVYYRGVLNISLSVHNIISDMFRPVVGHQHGNHSYTIQHYNLLLS